MAPFVDRARSVEVMERVMAASPILTEPKRRNLRRKAEDLWEGRTVWESLPVRLQFEPNRRCQLACIHCDIAHPTDSVLPFRAMERLFGELGEGLLEVMPYVGGEPTLAPLEEIAALCRRHRCYMNFTTNGLLLDRARFEGIVDAAGRILFSFHSHVPEVFRHIEPTADYETVVGNLRDCIEVAAPHQVPMLAGICLMDRNVALLADWFRFVADLGIRHVSMTKLHPNTADRERIDMYGRREPKEIEDLVGRAMEVAIRSEIFVETNVPEAYYTRFPQNRPTRETPFDILREVNGICSLFRPGFCPLLSNTITVEYDGTVLPCVRAHMEIGNVLREDFASLWNGPRLRRLRETFVRRSLFRECSGCLDFYSDTLHPSMPPMGDAGTWFAKEFAPGRGADAARSPRGEAR